jgi:hypothetical protein
MKADELKHCLDREVDIWCRKDYCTLLKELKDDVAYQSSDVSSKYQVEVQLLESKPEYIHVMVAVDDGTIFRSFKPLSWSFIVHSDGRVER